jgi:predicted RNA-binding protein with RPS1 domain
MSLEQQNKHLVNDLLYAIESCMEDAILEYIAPNVELSEIADEQERETISMLIDVRNGQKKDERFRDEISSSFLKKEKTFTSKVRCIQKHKNFLEVAEKDKWADIFPILNQNIIKIRNDSFHNRPITDEYFTVIINFCSNCIEKNILIFASLKSELQNYDHPLSDASEKNNILKNFPHPDYFWHRFIGRAEIYHKIKNHLSSGRSIINIYGPGGYGKSALVDYLARELAKDSEYKKIIWFSDKNEWWDLEKNTVALLKTKTSFDKFKKNPVKGEEKSFEEISSNCKCLIIIDNLDTMLEEGIEFIEEYANPNRQFITTSRVMTETGSQQRLDSLRPSESLNLIRNINKFRFIKDISNMGDEALSEIASQLNHSPLHIKWYLESVDKGSSALNIPKDHQKITEFCFSGLLETLDDKEKQLLNIYNIFQKPVGNLEISHVFTMPLNEIDPINLKLHRHGFIKKESSEGGYKQYILNTDIRPLLANKDLSDLKDALEIQNKIKEMNKRISRLKEEVSNSNMNFFDLKAYELANNSDAFICWRLEEIQYEYQRENSRDHQKALRKQIERFEGLLEIIPNNVQVLIAASLAYNFNDQWLQANELLIRANNLSNSNFLKKRVLFFYCRLCDKTMEFSEGLSAAQQLYDLDKSIETFDMYLQMLIGTQQGSKALDAISGFNQEVIDEQNESSGNKFIMLFLKALRVCLIGGSEDLYENDYKKIYEAVEKIIPLSGKYIDMIALNNLLKFICLLDNKYNQYIQNALRDKIFEAQDIILLLIKEAERNNRIQVISILEKVNIADYKIMQEIFSSFKLDELPSAADSKIFNDSLDNRASFRGRVTGKWFVKGVDQGFYVKADDGSSACLSYKAASHGLSIGDIEDFYCYRIKSRYAFVHSSDMAPDPMAEAIEKKVSTQEDARNRQQWDQFTIDQVVNCKIKSIVGYGAFVFILDTDFQGLIHRNEVTSKFCKMGDINKFLQIDQEVEAMIISKDDEKKHLGLSIKALQAAPQINCKVGDEYIGTIEEIWNNGNSCVVTFDGDGDGLLHKRSFNRKVENINDLYRLGMEINIKILSIEKENNNIHLAEV